MLDIIVAVKDESGVYMRQRAAGLYRLSAYVLAVMTTEIIDVLRVSAVFAVIVYWMTNLMPAAVNFVGHWLVLVLMILAAESFGMLISVVLPSNALILAFNNCFMFFAIVTGARTAILCTFLYTSLFRHNIAVRTLK